MLQLGTTAWRMQLMVSTAAAVATDGSGEDVHSALNPVPVSDLSVCILTVMVGPVLVKGPGMEVPQNL